MPRQFQSERLAAARDSGHTARARCMAVRGEAGADADGRPVTLLRHRPEFTAAGRPVVRYEERAPGRGGQRGL